jgi:hypothetical protein
MVINNYRGKCDVGGFLMFEWTLTIIVDSVVIEEAKRNSYTRVSPPRFSSGVAALGMNVKRR